MKFQNGERPKPKVHNATAAETERVTRLVRALKASTKTLQSNTDNGGICVFTDSDGLIVLSFRLKDSTIVYLRMTCMQATIVAEYLVESVLDFPKVTGHKLKDG